MAPRGRGLFEQATAAQKRAAVEAFRRTATGRAVDQYKRLERKVGGRNAITADLLKRLRNVQVGGILKNLMKDRRNVDRYARNPRKNALLEMLFKALGPVGSIFRSLMFPFRSVGIELGRQISAARNLLKAFGYVTIPPPGQGRNASLSDQQKMAEYLRSMGWTVGAPQSTGASPGASPTEPPPADPKTPPNRRSGKTKIGGKFYSDGDPVITGEMIKVQSSNVYAIGFVRNPGGAPTGMLKVQFKYHESGKNKGEGGPGATYGYYHIPISIFEAFQKAASKGEFVWDHLRRRGSATSHQVDWNIIGVSNGYVPRRADNRGAVEGEWFSPRNFTSEDGTMMRSSLPAQQIRGGTRRPNDGRPQRPSNGRPSGPNRGTPNRGR